MLVTSPGGLIKLLLGWKRLATDTVAVVGVAGPLVGLILVNEGTSSSEDESELSSLSEVVSSDDELDVSLSLSSLSELHEDFAIVCSAILSTAVSGSMIR
jgi:hypothetical protein